MSAICIVLSCDGLAFIATVGVSAVWTEEIAAEDGRVFFVDFAEQPAYGLVNKVVLMEQEDIGDGQEVAGLPFADEGHAADHSYALLPHSASVARQFVQNCSAFLCVASKRNRASRFERGISKKWRCARFECSAIRL